MRLPPTKKILREDIKDAPAWISAIIDPMNSFMENLYQAMNRNITYRENVACFVKDLVYKTTSTYPVEVDVEFLNELKTKATGVQVLQCVERSNYEPAAGPVYAPWIEVNGTIVLKAVTGLQASKTYNLRLLVT